MKYNKDILTTIHGSYPGIDIQVYTDRVIPLEDMKIIGDLWELVSLRTMLVSIGRNII